LDPQHFLFHLQQNFCFWWLFFILILHSFFLVNLIIQPTHLHLLWTILQCLPTHLTFQLQHLFLSWYIPKCLTEHFLCFLITTTWPFQWHFFNFVSQTSGLFFGVKVYLNEAHLLQLIQHFLLFPNLPTGTFSHFLEHFFLINGPTNLHFLFAQHLGALLLLQESLSKFIHLCVKVQHLFLFPLTVLTWLHLLFLFVVINLPVHLHLFNVE